jgi:cytidylate kinase
MMLGEVLNLSGPPGAGKTTVAGLLTQYAEPSVHLDGDAFMMSIRRGFVLPWLAGSGDQNRTVISAVAAAATSFARGGYFVVVDALIGPWFLDTFRSRLDDLQVRLHYVILRPSLALARAQARRGEALTEAGPIRQMWHAFEDVGPYEAHVVDPTDLSPHDVAALVWRRANDGRFALGP